MDRSERRASYSEIIELDDRIERNCCLCRRRRRHCRCSTTLARHVLRVYVSGKTRGHWTWENEYTFQREINKTESSHSLHFAA